MTNNPANLFSAQKNLLIFYTHTNLDQALSLGNRMLKDVEQTVPMALKELYFLIAVIFTFIKILEHILPKERVLNCKKSLQKLFEDES